MAASHSGGNATNPDRTSQVMLIQYFFIWKALLLVVACTSPGPGYDTSTEVLFGQYQQSSPSWFGRAIEHLVLRLTRWDGIYFSSNAARGHLNEQDWAFSWALARVTSFISRVFFSHLPISHIARDAMTGILISHISHPLAVITLYHITLNVLPFSEAVKRRVAFTASCLHIIAPAGLFLSAPFGESAFAMLAFAGTLCYVYAQRVRSTSPEEVLQAAFWLLLSGACFGLSTMVRSNGILGGLNFAWDAIAMLLQPWALFNDRKHLLQFAATIGAGSLVGIGFAASQVVAYIEYCTGGNTRPWCTKLVPSIYSWVQDYYWEVGFLRYWTLSNIPLFLLAAPMLVILLYTGYIGLFRCQSMIPAGDAKKVAAPSDIERRIYNHMIPRLALPQLVLTIMAATSFHVQIINRISSGYPLWYILLAIAICGTSKESTASRTQTQGRSTLQSGFHLNRKSSQWIVRGMVMYAVVQGGLYASFLPPA